MTFEYQNYAIVEGKRAGSHWLVTPDGDMIRASAIVALLNVSDEDGEGTELVLNERNGFVLPVHPVKVAEQLARLETTPRGTLVVCVPE